MFDSSYWYALRLNLQGNLRVFWLEWGGDLAELAAAAAIAFFIYVLVTPEKFAPDNRKENRRIRSENRRASRAATRIQSQYRGNKARGQYDKGKGAPAGPDSSDADE